MSFRVVLELRRDGSVVMSASKMEERERVRPCRKVSL
jgi:hypothetical protein